MTARVRDAEVTDYPIILRLNQEEVQWTSPLTSESLHLLATLAAYHKVVQIDAAIAGFILALRDGCGYENTNLAWFEGRYSEFLYVDRIVIDGGFAGRGLGKLLYNDARTFAASEDLQYVVCEFCMAPMNAASRAFHSSQGFVEVGQRSIDGEKVVSMQLLEL